MNKTDTETGREIFLTVKELGKILPISPSGIYQLIGNGTIRSVRLGRRILVPASEVDRLLSQVA